MVDIIIFWIYWSWKWTQISRLINEFPDKFEIFEPWNILRALKSNNNPIWNHIRDIQNRWDLLEDELIISLFDAFLAILPKHKFIIFDWFPRKMYQTFLMLDRYKRSKREFKCIELVLSQEESIKRMSNRRVCMDCNLSYNLLLDKNIQNCSKCWKQLSIREDDRPDIIKKRIDIYNKEIVPVIDYFKNNFNFLSIDADKNLDNIFNTIKKILFN